MKKYTSIYLIVLLLLASLIGLLLFGLGNGNKKERVTSKNLRIVSLMPSLTQSMYYLGAQDKLVGCTSYCMPAPEDSIEIVSSAVKPNIEKIVSLKPDLVLASGLIPEKEIETFRKFGIQVETFLSPKSFDGICTEFMRLAQLVGEEDKAKEIIDETKAKAEAIRLKKSSKGTPSRMFMQIGASPIFTVLRNTFMDDYMNYCGGVNISKDLTAGTIGREFVLAQDPEYIFIVTMGIAGNEEADQWKQFPQMSATVKDNIFILNSDDACQATPFTFLKTLELMDKLTE